jgi:hypothetical protein
VLDHTRACNSKLILGRGLKTRVTALLDRAVRSREEARTSQEERLAILKLVHRPQEQAESDDFERLRAGQTPDKALLLVAQSCRGLDFALASIDFFAQTDDRSFLALARQGLNLADSVDQFY